MAMGYTQTRRDGRYCLAMNLKGLAKFTQTDVANVRIDVGDVTAYTYIYV